MSTRGFLGFVADGTEKIAYNHFDSYPDGLGLNVLRWARDADLVAAADAARAIRVVPHDAPAPTPEDVERYRKWLHRRNARPGQPLDQPDDWYDLLYETRGNPAAILEAGAIQDSSEFPLDSLFAEWGYVVDFDEGALEAYRGFQHAPHSGGRFAGRGPYIPPHRAGQPAEYWPVALVQSWPLKDLPSDEEFVAVLEPPDEDD